MSIQAVKGVEIGAGIAAATPYGSETMDEIGYDAAAKQFTRARTAPGAPGLDYQLRRLVVRVPEIIPTPCTPSVRSPWRLIAPKTAAFERSNVCVVPAVGVAGEVMVSFVLAESLRKISAATRQGRCAVISTDAYTN